jgi:ABC-type nitrate/sulfonate/bicarbonate transport system permease component
MANYARYLWPVVGLVGFLAVWAVASLVLHNPILLPSPAAAAQSLVQLARHGVIWTDIAASLKRVLTGFGFASALAVPLGLALAYFKTARQIVVPVITLLRPIPPIAWIPLAILWFGLGDKPGFFITGLAAFFPIFINVFSGGLSVESEHLHAARCLGAKRWALLRWVYLPSALPLIWTGLRIGLGQAWMAVVTAELIAAHSGLGFFIQASRTNLETANVLVGMLVIGVVGSLMTALLGASERFVLPWRRTDFHG